MMRKKYNNHGGGGQNKNRHGGGGGGGGRRYNNNGGNRSGGDGGGQNITRQKHHATQMREKFSNMARDAQNNGDRVDVEYYLQHVDHYTRVLTEIAAIEAERFAHQPREQQPQPPEGGESQSHSADRAQNTSPSHGDAGHDASEGAQAPITTGNNQPRMTRQPRHARPQDSHGGDSSGGNQGSGNDDSGDIPLPGSALPVI